MSDMENHERHFGVFTDPTLFPLERWDPLRTVTGPYNEKIGHYCQIAPLRMEKNGQKLTPLPNSLITEEGEDSIFQMVSGNFPCIPISKNAEIINDPFTAELQKFEDSDNADVASIINLYTPAGRIFTSNMKISEKFLYGVPLIHFLTKHYNFIEQVPKEELAMLFRGMAVTQSYIHEIALKRDKNYQLTSILDFFNIGIHAGTLIPHLHANSLLYINKKGHGWRTHGFILAPEYHKDLTKLSSYCYACQIQNLPQYDPLGQMAYLAERFVYENDTWQVITAYAPEKDGHLRIIPKRHVKRLIDLKKEEFTDLADALIIANKALSSFVSKNGTALKLSWDRNILVRQQYLGYTGAFHLFLEILPIQSTSGAELMDNHHISEIFPERVAALMREYLRELQKNN